MSNGPEGSGGRWWEIRGEGQSDEGDHRELMVGSRGRSRPERLLSVGADLADESRYPSPAFLWSAASVFAAVGLILAVMYVVPAGKAQRPEDAMPAPPTVRSSAPGDREAKPDVGARSDGGSRPFMSLTRSEPPQVSGGNMLQPTLPRHDAPTGPPVSPGPASNPGPVVTPSRPIDLPNGSSGGAGGDSGNHTPETPTPSPTAPPPDLPAKLDTLEDRAPTRPSTQQSGPEVPRKGTDSCERTNEYYTCTIKWTAPLYFAGTTKPDGKAEPGAFEAFLCQSAGSRYSVGNRASYWWAWLWLSGNTIGVWVPVVFLKGGPDNGPEPGLPVCDSAPRSTTTAKPAPTSTRQCSRNHHDAHR